MILSSARFPHDSPPLTPPTPPSQNNQPLPEPSSPLLQQVSQPVGIVSTMDGVGCECCYAQQCWDWFRAE